MGNCLKDIREKLNNNEKIDFSFKSRIECIQVNEYDIYSWNKQYNQKIRDLLDTETSLLLIHPDSQNINSRKNIIKTFKNRFYLVEAIDSKEFYNLAKIFNINNLESIYNKIYRVIYQIFNKSELDKWFNAKGLKNKRDEKDKKIIAPIKAYLADLGKNVSLSLVSKILSLIKKLPKVKCYRKELFNDLCKALEKAEFQNILVYEAMKNIRNFKRRVGRKIKGKCIGTTLLTKGLEFKTVVILDAHKFKCPKNLYVALTRASKNLVIFSNSQTLSSYNNIQNE